MTSNERREKRAAQGLCTRCGKSLDTDCKKQLRLCAECRKRSREQKRERNRWYLERGICPCCGKKEVMKGRKTCLECRMDENEKRRQNYADMAAEQKESYLRKKRDDYKRRYQERKKNGICTKCGKRKAETGKTKCSICLSKGRIRRRTAHQKAHDMLPREDRIAYGLCYICGSPLDGAKDWKVCSRCHERMADVMIRNSQKRSQEHSWRNANNLIFDSQLRRYCETGKREGAVQ